MRVGLEEFLDTSEGLSSTELAALQRLEELPVMCDRRVS